jgi:hypothetical protein
MFLIRLTCVKISRHLDDITQSHDSSNDLMRFSDIDEIIFWILFRERNASNDDSNVNEIEEKTSWCNSVKYSSFKWIFEKLTTFFINASNKIAILLKVDEKNDRDDCVTNRNSELTDDDDNENDDEVRSKKRLTEIILWFFFSIDDNTIESKKITKVVFRFFFFFNDATSDDDIVKRMTNNSDDYNVVNYEFKQNASSIRDESNSLFVTFIQFLLIDFLFIDISLARFINRFSIVKFTTRRTSFKLKLRRTQRHILLNNWTNWLCANFFSFDFQNTLIRRNVFS